MTMIPVFVPQMPEHDDRLRCPKCKHRFTPRENKLTFWESVGLGVMSLGVLALGAFLLSVLIRFVLGPIAKFGLGL